MFPNYGNISLLLVTFNIILILIKDKSAFEILIGDTSCVTKTEYIYIRIYCNEYLRNNILYKI